MAKTHETHDCEAEVTPDTNGDYLAEINNCLSGDLFVNPIAKEGKALAFNDSYDDRNPCLGIVSRQVSSQM